MDDNKKQEKITLESLYEYLHESEKKSNREFVQMRERSDKEWQKIREESNEE
ncbi:MAG: hypothetical protein FWH53_01340 [Leptospirales bacterium]|nr:hypothetical protein [Leptospirales bacterium]